MSKKGKNEKVSKGVTRRTFMKAAGTTATVAIASGYSPFSYAKNEKVRVACIGTGSQNNYHITNGLTLAEDIEFAAFCDVYKRNKLVETGWVKENDPDGKIPWYMDYREMLDKGDFEAVVIATPLHTHHKIAMDCLDAGKYVYCEKTLCYDIEHCRDIVKKCHETGLFCQVGHQRRYNPEYNKAMWLAHGDEEAPGLVGRINHLTAQWHRNNKWRRPLLQTTEELSPEERKYIPDLERHVNWRLYKDTSGGLVTELLTHQVDIFNWFLGSVPKRVHGYGGTDYWRDGREVCDNLVVIYEYEIGYNDLGYHAIPQRVDEQSPARINRPYKIRATYSTIAANAKRGVSELIQGDRASIELTERYGCHMFGEAAIRAEEEAKAKAAAAVAEGGADAKVEEDTLMLPNEAYKEGIRVNVYDPHNKDEFFRNPRGVGVDRLQFEAFANDLKTGGTPKANQVVGLQTAVAGLAALKAIREGVEVEIKPEWYSFDFETPDPYRYDYFEGPERREKEEKKRKEQETKA